MRETTYVIGHRNPDADAICSAIGYAAFKSSVAEGNFQPARCGNSNARIETILSTMNVPLPEFVGDVTPRVRDIMVTEVIQVDPEAICAKALDLIDQHDVRVLPVVGKDGRLEGSISIFDLGDHFVPKPREERKMRHVFASLEDITGALGADPIHIVDPGKIEDLFVRIGAMDIRSFGRYYKEDESLAKSSIIIVGDRYDIQQRSIHSGVRMLVISGGLPVEPDVVELAKERGVSIIVSPHDSATTSWIIRSAGRIDSLVRKQTIKFGPDEKLSAVRRKLSSKNAAAYMVTDEEDRLIGVFTKTDLLKPVRKNLILVDHNELSQAVPGAEQVDILEVVDHHRLGNPPTQQPITFINLPVGSTSTIVADLFRKHQLEPEAKIAGVLMGGIVSDTLNLKGPTTTQTDRDMLTWLEGISGVKAEVLAEAIFNAGSIIKSETPENVIRSDMKIYDEGNFRFSVSQVEELGFDNLWSCREELDQTLDKIQRAEGLLFAALLVTDVNSQNSLLLIRGEDVVIENITYPHQAANDTFELNGIVSRKKQLIPYLTTIVRQVAPELIH
ncbi:putative manganese-dependent inorganic diphosphatase [Puniceicoccales bacterium CK1056]|uniref:inorganic diphosphatase n=1 Tax=Oceanipulchritudo coccoides TaxID=2706888 RepID=A0A6B2LYE9_9BACT|nr:putative manganese-dependent inorganic diphosphatase [Oceanipulchritudo coccoides]NDV61162.1 putative manganese-dependent inorganic diphosphatase [Oceanipulchritudo coccoides]